MEFLEIILTMPKDIQLNQIKEINVTNKIIEINITNLVVTMETNHRFLLDNKKIKL